jgi:hypothetical protein
MADTNLSLKDTVLAAYNEQAKAEGAIPAGEVKVVDDKIVTDEAPEEVKEPVKEPAKELEKEEAKEEDDVVEIDASPDEIRSALNIFRKLSSKETSAQTLQELMRVTGYDPAKPADVKQIKRDLKTIMREKLGDSYDLLSGDKLAEAMEEVLDTRVKEVTEPVLNRIAEAERTAHLEQANTAMDSLWKRHDVKDPKVREQISGKMMERMQVMPPGAGVDVSSYLDDVYYLVTRDSDAARAVKKTVTKIRQNAKDVRETSGGGNSPDEGRVKIGPGGKLPSLKESIAAAFRGEKFDFDK